jgi:hypothetical protein
MSICLEFPNSVLKLAGKILLLLPDLMIAHKRAVASYQFAI